MFKFSDIKRITQSENYIVAILKIASIVLFALSFFSIPTVSFITKLKNITWVLTIITVLSMVLVLLLSKNKIRVDFISLSFILFGFFAFFSSLINGMRAFVFTPILLSILSCLIYLYCKNNKDQIKPLFIASYVGLVFFLLVFAFTYRYELIHLQFSRLGSKFGDINDIALFMGLGCVMSFSIFLYAKKWYFKVPCAVLFFAFVLCGFSSSSKSFLFILAICLLTQIFVFFGKKKWWISIFISAGLISLFFIFINLPFMSGFKQRLLDMFSTLTQDQRISGSNTDLSTIDRLNMFLDGMTMWLRKPIFGYGIQGFFRASSYGGGWSHNHFSETLASFGIVGAFLFHFGYVKGICGFFTTKKERMQKMLGILFLFFIICMFFVALNSQKIYAFLIPLPIAFFEKEKKNKEVYSIQLYLDKRKKSNA